ncbi:insulinase family protein [Candidatus Daviesbacteria bacterium]|nr:insulinase family protein [Candidatus Daviesbacteria bacterium]
MHKVTQLKNGLTLITVDLPHLDSVTTLFAVGVGSRYETKKINGISHFLEHMFFKGSRKYPTAEMISTLVDGIGAINNAYTHKECTVYWIKSASKHLEFSSDIISSMVKESLLKEDEIEREKGVIVEELRMIRDNPSQYVGSLYERLQFGDTPLGWDIGGQEEIITQLKRNDFIAFTDSFYSPENMALVFAGKLPKDIEKLAEIYFSDLPPRAKHKCKPYKIKRQIKPKVNVFFKKTDQANLILGVLGYSRHDGKKYSISLLSTILGEGMSSRLFIQVRERRGLAYYINAGPGFYSDTGNFSVYCGLKLEKVYEGLEVIIAELQKVIVEKVTKDELKKAKEMIRGRLAIREESTNFLAEYFGTNFVTDREIETFDEYLKKIDAVTREDIQDVAREIFKKEHFNLQIIGPFKDTQIFRNILNR